MAAPLRPATEPPPLAYRSVPFPSVPHQAQPRKPLTALLFLPGNPAAAKNHPLYQLHKASSPPAQPASFSFSLSSSNKLQTSFQQVNNTINQLFLSSLIYLFNSQILEVDRTSQQHHKNPTTTLTTLQQIEALNLDHTVVKTFSNLLNSYVYLKQKQSITMVRSEGRHLC